jgi:lipopolysaccharide transport system permease protein
MQTFKTTPSEAVRSIWTHRSLLYALIKREVVGRYRGSIFGILWSFLNPLLMLGVYSFVFGVVFRARWGSAEESRSDFVIALFAGLVVFNLFSECINRAPALITGNVNYVKRVVFPLEILSCVTLGSALFHTLISLVVWLLCYVVLKGTPHAYVMFAPLALAPLLMLTLGLSWLISSLGVFIRDISQVISLAVSVLLFLSPVFYPISALPTLAQEIMRWNPIALSLEQVRGVLLYGQLPDATIYLSYLVGASIWAWVCFMWFQRSRRAFADVL